jgi:putative ABC transport system ATP-binding protein
MLTVDHISKSFKTKGSAAVHVLHDVSFVTPNTTCLAILGRSGSGKSTLLSLLGGLDTSDEGVITLDGEDISTLSPRQLTRYRSRSVGFVFQQFNLIPNLSALENVMLPMEFAHAPARDRKARAQALLESVGIRGDKQQRHPSYLSGGEQQRVAIARALVNNPKLILADEPTGNLDSATGQIIIQLLRDLADAKRATVIIITHDKEIAQLCDRRIVLADGEVRSAR